LADRPAQQQLHAVPDIAEDLLLRPLRNAQLGEREVHRLRDVVLRLDQRAVKIEDQQIDRGLRRHQRAFRKSSRSAANRSSLATSVSVSSDCRTKLIMRFWSTCGGTIGSMMRHKPWTALMWNDTRSIFRSERNVACSQYRCPTTLKSTGITTSRFAR